METPLHPSVRPLKTLLSLHTKLLLNVLEDVDDATAQRRPNAQTNNMAFIALHLVDVRYFLASYLDERADSPFHALLENVTHVNETTAFPLVAEVRAAWQDASALLERRFATLTDADLAQASPQPFPTPDATVLGGVSFLLHHEAYHIGQLALLRTYFGLPPMRYA